MIDVEAIAARDAWEANRAAVRQESLMRAGQLADEAADADREISAADRQTSREFLASARGEVPLTALEICQRATSGPEPMGRDASASWGSDLRPELMIGDTVLRPRETIEAAESPDDYDGALARHRLGRRSIRPHLMRQAEEQLARSGRPVRPAAVRPDPVPVPASWTQAGLGKLADF